MIYSKNKLSEEEKEALLSRINSTIANKKPMRTVRSKITLRFIYAAAAVILLIIGVNYYFSIKNNIIDNFKNETIVCNLLNDENIKLITNNESISFDNDLNIELDKNGKLKVAEENNGKQASIDVKEEEIITMVVPYGKQSTLTLSDGSKLWINSGSELQFPARFNNNKRNIKLVRGEMFIEVAHDLKKPFYVHTSNFDIKVYGTSFNLTNYSDSLQSVVLVSGKIGLKPFLANESIILPNEQALLKRNGTVEKKEVDVEKYISWRNGYLLASKTPISELLQHIGRYYNFTFEFDKNSDNINNLTCTGKIYLSDNVENVIKTINLLTSTKYIREDNKIFIYN